MEAFGHHFINHRMVKEGGNPSNGRDYKCKITKEDVLRAIKNLKKSIYPGINEVTPEHIIYAASHELADILADTYSIMISFAIIPDIFQNSLIVPILNPLAHIECNSKHQILALHCLASRLNRRL